MAIYHLQSGFVSRSTGRSSVQSAAYITGEKLHEERRSIDVNYRNRHSDIAFTSTLAPEHVPEEFRNANVWNILEKFEDEYAIKRFPNNLEAREKYLNSAQTAQTIVVALPRELNVKVSKELVEEFSKERFVSRGLIVTYAVHDDEGNPHAHLQISRRSVNEKGELSWAKDRDIVTRKSLLETRKSWTYLTNKYLEREGFAERITEKSFADLGINLEPGKHRGWVSDKLEAMGVTSRMMEENAEIAVRNKETLIENPGNVLAELTSKQATFSQLNLLKTIQKRVGDDDRLVSYVFAGVLKEAVVVGEGISGEMRYTSQTYQEMEVQAVKSASELFQEKFKQDEINQEHNHNYLNENFSYLSEEQQQAVIGLTEDNRLSLLIGRAGAGKTTTLKAVAEIYHEAGYRVVGTSLSAMAADNLGKETGIESHTLHSWLYKWNRYQQAQEKFLSFNNVMEEGLFKQLDWYKDLQEYQSAALTSKDVLIVDEAGMVGTRQWNELLTHVKHSGAKLIAVGDDNQFKAIEAGDFFRELKTQGQSQASHVFELKEIRRQEQGWMKEASHQLSQLNTHEALSAYEQKGHVHQVAREELSHEIAGAYVEKLKQGKEGLVLAFTNVQVKELNQSIRQQLKTEDLLEKEDIISINGYSLAKGEKIVFLTNDKQILKVTDQQGVIQENHYIKNGTKGVIEGFNQYGDIIIGLKDNMQTIIPCHTVTSKAAIGQNPTFNKEYAYTNIAPGYAVTTHKSQGQTVDFTIVAASKNIDAKGLYVAMTRHRKDVQVFYAKEDFPTFKALTNQLSRFDHKDLVKDYTIRAENETYWQRVQDYKLCSLDAAAVLKEQGIDWQSYRQIKQDQVALGKEMLKDWDSHKLYINQSSLTQEMLQITSGHKPRPLSLQEEKAKLTVELYAEQAQLARSLWREIRTTHPGAKCHAHELYGQFKQVQQERNSLANVINENYTLHREFMGALSREYGISKRTVNTQSKQFIELALRQQVEDKPATLHHIGVYSPAPSQRHFVEPVIIKQELNSRIKDLAYEFLGQPQSQKATEWRYGNKGSISIHVAGHRQGLYSNFETGESGNALKLIQDKLDCDYKEAFKWGAEWLENVGSPEVGVTRLPSPSYQTKTINTKQEWQVIYPALGKINLREPQLAYMLIGRQEIARYEYKDAEENTLGYVVRLEDKDGNKITPTLTYCRNQEGKEQWRWQGFGNDRPLYGLEQLKTKPHAPILVVEGEKTCNAAREIFKDHALVTWSGGCGAVAKSDWSVLKDRDVTIWPDNDKPGIKAAENITTLLKEHDIDARTVNLSSKLPHKWDLADKIPDGLNVNEQLTKVKTAQSLHLNPLTKAQQDQQERLDSISKYLKMEITQEKYPWLSDFATQGLRTMAQSNPQLALESWQSLTKNYTFKPLTFEEMQDKIQHATQLFQSLAEKISDKGQEQIPKVIQTDPQRVIDYCQGLAQKEQQQIMIADFKEFTALAKEYERLPGSMRDELIGIKHKLGDIYNRYADSQVFNRAIDNNKTTKDAKDLLEAIKRNQELQKTQQQEITLNLGGFER